MSDDGSAAMAPVTFTEPQMAVTTATKDALVATFKDAPVDGVSVDFSSSIASELPALVGPGELVGLAVAAIVLFMLLGTLVAAGLPILTALIGVGIATLGALSLSNVLEMTSVTPVLGIMLGLAVGIDYALFIVNRHRRQLTEGYAVEESIALANGTSGNAVVFAGATVIIALVALNVTGIPFLGLMGTIGAASVAIAVLIAISLTPALLSFAGTRVLRGREKARIETGVLAMPAPATPLPSWRARGPGRHRDRRAGPPRPARGFDAARAPGGLRRGCRLHPVPRIHHRRGLVRRGPERHAARDRRPAGGHHRRRAPGPPGAGRRGDRRASTTSPPSRLS